MKTRPTQFGVRENTASSRQHASRLAVNPLGEEQPIGFGSAQAEAKPPSDPRIVESFQLPLSDGASGATRVERREPNRLLTVEEVASLSSRPRVVGVRTDAQKIVGEAAGLPPRKILALPRIETPRMAEPP